MAYSLSFAGASERAGRHGLVAMLHDNLIKNTQQAIEAIRDGDTQRRYDAISMCLDILDTLRAGLNFSDDGSFAERLDSLYEDAQRQLVMVDRDANVLLLHKIRKLFERVRRVSQSRL